jgi:hypothetical protein
MYLDKLTASTRGRLSVCKLLPMLAVVIFALVYKENKLLNNSTRHIHNLNKFYNIINKLVKQNIKEKTKGREK